MPNNLVSIVTGVVTDRNNTSRDFTFIVFIIPYHEEYDLPRRTITQSIYSENPDNTKVWLLEFLSRGLTNIKYISLVRVARCYLFKIRKPRR